MFKRAFDVCSSLLGLLFLFPLLLVIAGWIRLDAGKPVLYRQTRVGIHGRLFSILKFRTMEVDADKKGMQVTVGEDSRITKSGFILRKSKLDELPQLINVFFGDMSIVGPRPEVPEFMNEYPAEIRDVILSVRPGITDKASIEFTNEAHILSESKDPYSAYINNVMPIKAQYYLEYVKSRTFFGDIAIILQTLKKIVL